MIPFPESLQVLGSPDLLEGHKLRFRQCLLSNYGLVQAQAGVTIKHTEIKFTTRKQLGRIDGSRKLAVDHLAPAHVQFARCRVPKGGLSVEADREPHPMCCFKQGLSAQEKHVPAHQFLESRAQMSRLGRDSGFLLRVSSGRVGPFEGQEPGPEQQEGLLEEFLRQRKEVVS